MPKTVHHYTDPDLYNDNMRKKRNILDFNNGWRSYSQYSNKSSSGRDFLANVSHKNSLGCNNWNKFLEMDSSEVKRHNNNKDNIKSFKRRDSFYDNHTVSFPSDTRGPDQRPKITKVVAMDCEMVGAGLNGSESMLARVSLVNSFGDCIYDKYVKPTQKVTDYRTFVSGIRPHNLKTGEDFFEVRDEVRWLLKGKILVGHSIKHDLDALNITHPFKWTRDTYRFPPFRNTKGGLSLKKLTKEILGVDIQDGEHNSVIDAKAAMQLYMTVRKTWESMYSNGMY